MTEWALPGRACPCCGAVTFADPPAGAHQGSVSYGPALNAAAVLLSCYENVPPERAARVIGMLLGIEVCAGRAGKAATRVNAQLQKASPHSTPSPAPSPGSPGYHHSPPSADANSRPP